MTNGESEPAAPEELRRLAGPLFGALARSDLSVVVSDPRQPGSPVVFVNAAFTRLTGYAPEEVIGRACRLLQAPEADSGTLDALAATLRNGQPFETELLSRRKDGSRFWNSLVITPLMDEAGRPAFFLAMRADTTAIQKTSGVPNEARTNRQALDDASDRLRATLSTCGIMASWDWHIAERRVVGDARFAALYRLGEEEAARGVTPGAFFSIIHPQDQMRIRLAVGGMLRGAEVFSKEYRILLPDGATRWVHARGRCYREDENDPGGRFVGTLVDVTDQKRAEERLRVAQTAGGIGTFEYVHGFGTASVSAEFCHLLGLQQAQDLPLRTINAVVHPQDTPIIDVLTRPQVGSISQAEFRITRPDTGETRWLMRRGEFQQDMETSDIRFSGVIYDVTDAKRSEAELRRLNGRLEASVAERTADRNRLWRLSAEIMLVAHFDGTITAINPAWKAVLGWSEIDLLGHDFFALIHQDDIGHVREGISALSRQESLMRFDSRCRSREGTYRWISWSAASGEGLINAVGRDVTAEKEQAEALRQAEEQLRQSQKMEAVGQLTGGLAHDFNNLLTGIIGSLELLKTRMAQGRLSQADRYITAAQGAANRAAALTHRLLAFSRRQTLAPKPTHPNRLIDSMAELIQRTMGPGIQVETALAAGLWATLCDPNQLENALLNLCINARDAMPDGGRLIIETANIRIDERGSRQRGMAPGLYVSISVTDTGTGMTPEVMARAFDPFFTTKPIGQGTGLGLSMIYGFAKQSGGQIRIYSEENQGTTMRLYLPRYQGEVESENTQADLVPVPRAERGETVLVVDDEPTVRMLVTEVLEDLGYTAIEVADGPAGLQVLQSDTRIDLLVTDVGLPSGMNGRQLADAGRMLRPDLKVLFITGYAESAVLGDGHLEPGMHVLSKPFQMDLLASRIREMISGT
ncbi:hybrid sensor histidine kinase/response regulator [Roseomonas xinghualingensis]|uniref:hybrid sensor histidine kinase/response regulator n=1 Tax=Roseomonas xinghualingensis TaxID=2986475 RepID=UPI0021F2305D|nr:PAS domain S-box protein [Roseomonas sp. SXEYE001]MCV4206330.1 PAS domain S-box protein [Roseomonas sp. SXEYE001]